MSKLIYRIEHPASGFGMWRHYSEFIGERLHRSGFHFLDSRHGNFPTPTRDSGIYFGFIVGTHFCAYNSLEDLCRWVTKHEIKRLAKRGFKVYQIEAKRTIKGQYQTIYRKKDIKSIIDITNTLI